MLQEQQRPVVDARQASSETSILTVALSLVLDCLLLDLPFLPERRVREAVRERLTLVAVLQERVPEVDVRGVLVLDDEVCLGHGEGQGVELLAEQVQGGLSVVLA